MIHKFFHRTSYGIFFFLIILIGCRSATRVVTFYNMTAIDRIEIDNSEKVTQDTVIGIEPAQFPSFLKRPQIIFRSSNNSFNFAEYHRWGVVLDQDFSKILAENLSILLNTNQVFIFPLRNPIDPNYRIECNVHQFDGKLNDSVTLNVTWMIRKKDSKTLHVKKSIIHKSVSDKGYNAIVSAHSQAIAELSRKIAATIKEMHQD